MEDLQLGAEGALILCVGSSVELWREAGGEYQLTLSAVLLRRSRLYFSTVVDGPVDSPPEHNLTRAAKHKRRDQPSLGRRGQSREDTCCDISQSRNIVSIDDNCPTSILTT